MSTRPDQPVTGPASPSSAPADAAGCPQAPDRVRPAFPPDPLPKIIPGASVNLLAGAPGAGKTALMAWLATRFRDTLPIFGVQPVAVPKLAIVCADRSWHQSTRQWFDLVGFPNICAYSLQDDRTFRKSRLRRKQERIAILHTCLEHVDPLPHGSLLFVDPLALFLGGNINDYDACAVACSEIREICQEQGITIIGTAHAGKQKADANQRYLRLQDRIAGSVALFGYTDTQLYLAEPAEVAEEFYLFQWHPHHAPAESFKLVRAENGLFVPYEGAEDVTLPLTETQRAILERVPTSPQIIATTELRDLLPEISRRTLFSSLKVLAARGDVVKVGYGHYTRRKVH